MKTKIGIIGGGNMGSAIIAGIIKKYAVSVCEPDSRRKQYLKRRFNIKAKDLTAVVKGSKIIILALKPQSFDGVLKQLRSALTQNKLIISIAAGITTTYIEKRLGKKIRVIRTMPNLPAQVKSGITCISQGRFATKADLKTARTIFNGIGKTVEVKENALDAVTAVSGSGPAYVFLFVECLIKAARSLGLKEDLSKSLVTETLKGSLALLDEKNIDAAKLRSQVTSKGGTTQAAMDVFKKRKFEAMVKEALKAAKKRAKVLAKT